MLTQASLFGLCVLLIIAAFGDIRRYIIPNRISLAIILLYPLFILGQVMDGTALGSVPWLASILTALGVLVFFTILFAFGLMGGGDVKLFAAVSLWTGPLYTLEFLFISSISGGVLALLVHYRNRLTNKKQAPVPVPVQGPAAGKTMIAPAKVPYGVAIAIGGLFIASQLIVNAFHQY